MTSTEIGLLPMTTSRLKSRTPNKSSKSMGARPESPMAIQDSTSTEVAPVIIHITPETSWPKTDQMKTSA